MNTFLPYDDFAASAAVLDSRRLGKQRVECLQILNCLAEPNGWIHHPAVQMWVGYPEALAWYAIVVCDEWRMRGYEDHVRDRLMEEHPVDWVPEVPPWLGVMDVHVSHRSNLVRKAPDHYRPYFPEVPDDLPYVWPEHG